MGFGSDEGADDDEEEEFDKDVVTASVGRNRTKTARSQRTGMTASKDLRKRSAKVRDFLFLRASRDLGKIP